MIALNRFVLPPWGWLSLLFVLPGGAFALGTNSWVNIGSGLWRESANWSSNQPPNTNFSHVLINNPASKVVTIDALTENTNLVVTNLIVSALSGSTNTLSLVDLTTNRPLEIWRTLTVESGGAVDISNSGIRFNGGAGISFFDLAAGSAVLNSGSILCNGASARLGRSNGREGRLTILGGRMLAGLVQLGSATGSQGTLNVAGGVFESSSLFTAGFSPGSTGSVWLSAGALIVTNDLCYIGQSGFGEMAQSGGSATFTFLTVGNNADGILHLNNGLLTIRPRTTNDLFRVGNLGHGEVHISGGTNLVLGEFHVADTDIGSGLVSITGGRLIATNDLTAIGRHGVGQMTISNASVQLTNTSVGRHDGSFGYLTVQTNGLLTLIQDLSIGRFSNSVGSVLIDGGTLSLPNDNIWVGREGLGDLTISNGTVQAKSIFVALSTDPTNMPSGTLSLVGGQIFISSDFVVGTEAFSTGHVSVAGGQLIATNTAASASLIIPSGTFTINGGSLIVDRIFLTNSSSELNIVGGTLQAKYMTVSNGLPFVVGDGVQPAKLNLLGGNFFFANGLVISSNASVEGCGTIVGNITNHGTLATNCPPTIAFTAINRVANSVSLSFSTVSNLTHVLEYKNQLNEANWTPLLPAFLGNGSVMTKVDSTASVPSRCYRIRAQ